MDNDVGNLRERAASLFALALRAAEHGQSVLATDLTALASEALSHAEAVGEGRACHCEGPRNHEQVALK